MVSGVLLYKIQTLTKHMQQIASVLKQTKIKISSDFYNDTSLNHDPGKTNAELMQEIAALRKAIEMIEQTDIAAISQRSASARNQQQTITPEQQYQIEQKQQQIEELILEAIIRGQWSHEDAMMFREYSSQLPTEVIKKMSGKIILGIRDGSIELEENLLMPF